MTTDAPTLDGPSGSIEFSGQTLVVERGTIYLDGKPIRFLFEDGMIKNLSADLNTPAAQLKSIEEFPGCVFRGIDSAGCALELPGRPPGPTGLLQYNNIALKVINGRVSTPDHKLVGELEDNGTLFLRDKVKQAPHRQLDEHTQLNTFFQGQSSAGEPLKHEFVRTLYKMDKSYAENEIMRYFEDFALLAANEQQYVKENLMLWASCGILQMVRKDEGTAGLGTKLVLGGGHASQRSGNVTYQRDDFELNIRLKSTSGIFGHSSQDLKPYVVVFSNVLVAHEFGQQIIFLLSQATQDHIESLYKQRLAKSKQLFPPPPDYDGEWELVPEDKIADRVFIAAYGKREWQKYFAESIAAFSFAEGRAQLKRIDPEIYSLLADLIYNPEKYLRAILVDTMLSLQASLRVGGEFT